MMLDIILIAFSICFAMNMGASGIAPAFSVVWGTNTSKGISIFLLFSLMVFAGALYAGEKTMHTIASQINYSCNDSLTLIGIVFFSITLSLFIANILGAPQSTSQSTVVALLASSVYFKSATSLKLLFVIIPTWFILPIIAFLFCFFFYKIYNGSILKKFNFFITSTSNFQRRIVIVAMYVAFSIGSNNVANITGPLFSIIDFKGNILLMLVLVAFFFGIGAKILGQRNLANTGSKLIEINISEGLIISLTSASLLLFASLYKGIPTSLVQLNVASILGIGAAKNGFKLLAVNHYLKKFATVWLISPIISFLCVYILLLLFNPQA